MRKIILFLGLVVILSGFVFADKIPPLSDDGWLAVWRFDVASGDIPDIKTNLHPKYDLSCTDVTYQAEAIDSVSNNSVQHSGNSYCNNSNFDTMINSMPSTNWTIITSFFGHSIIHDVLPMSTYGIFVDINADPPDGALMSIFYKESEDYRIRVSENLREKNLFWVLLRNGTTTYAYNGTEYKGQTEDSEHFRLGSNQGITFGTSYDKDSFYFMPNGSKIGFAAWYNDTLTMEQIQDLIENGFPDTTPPTYSTDRTDYYYDGTYYLTDHIGDGLALNGNTVAPGSSASTGGWAITGTPTYALGGDAGNDNMSILLDSATEAITMTLHNSSFTGSFGMNMNLTAMTSGDYYRLWAMDEPGESHFVGAYADGADSTTHWLYDGNNVCDVNSIKLNFTHGNEIVVNFTTSTSAIVYINGLVCHTYTDVMSSGISSIQFVSSRSGTSHARGTDFWVANGDRPKKEPDETPPTYSNFQNNASNTTKFNGIVNWSIYLADDVSLAGYIFAYNNSGKLENDSYKEISGESVFVNETVTINLSKGNYICSQFWFNDTSGNFNQTLLTEEGACFTIQNTAPTQPTIYYPKEGKNYSNIPYINYSATDIDGDSLNYSIYINGRLNISIVDANITDWNASDGYYNLTVTANDGTDSSSNSTVVHFRLDTKEPSWSGNETNAVLMKINGNATFNITVSDYGSGLSYYIFSWNGTGTWLNDTGGKISGSSVKLVINKSINLSYGNSIGYIWYANDSAGNWNNTILASFIVANTIPTITAPSINNSAPYKNDVLECINGSFIDADGGSAIWYYRWFENDALIAEQTNSTLDLSVSGLDNGDEIICEIIGGDGTDNSTPLNSSEVTLLNFIPTHSTPLLSSSSGTNYTNENLTCYNQSTFDADGEEITNIYNWYKDNEPINDLYLPFEINVNDYSGSGNDGTAYGGNFVNGKIGNGLEFNGSEYVSVSDDNLIDFTNRKTWEVWFKRATTGEETIFDKTNLNNNLTNYKLYFDNNNYLVFAYSIPGTAEGEYSWITKTKADFDEGSYSATNYTVDSVQLLPESTSGYYLSKILDVTALSSWNNILWTEELPYGEELPDNKGSDKGADMTGNVLLMHMNNDWNDSSNGNNGNAYNGATFTTSSKFGSHAGSFDGVDDYVKGSDAGWPDGDEPITMAAWIKTADNYGHIMVHGTWTNNQAIYLYVDNGKMVIGKWGGNHVGTFTVNDNQWHYVAGIWNGSKALVYVDGDLKDIGNFTGLNVVLNEYHITTSGWPLNCIIDEVSVWNRTLSSQEILNIYKRGILKLNLTLRSCDDSNCSGEGFDLTCADTPCDISSLTDSQYIQYRADFESNDTSYTPKLYNATIEYTEYSAGVDETILSSSTQIIDTDWHYAAVSFDDDIATDNFKLYLDDDEVVSKTEHNTSQYKDNDLYIGRDYQSTSFFEGILDEFRIYDYALTAEQINNNFLLNYNKITSTETTRLDDYICSITPNDGIVDGVTKNSSTLTIRNYVPSPSPTLIAPIDGYTSGALPEFNWTESFDNVDYDDIYYIIQIGNNSDFSSLDYINTLSEPRDTSVTLDSTKIDTYFWRVLATDNIDNTSWSSVRNFTYARWDIMFNVTSGEFEIGDLDNVSISSCNYTGFNQAGDTTNPYGPYAFPPGNWKCTFELTGYYDQTLKFIADDDKTVNVVMSLKGELTDQEHTWLEALYNCVILKDCELWDLLVTINQTASNIWQNVKPTDESVIISETQISNTLNSTSNITFEYTVSIPIKAGYSLGAYLPVRIGYWFMNESNESCYSQGTLPEGVTVIEPYCNPLMTEALGPMGGSINFRVDLRPNLAAGTYNVKRIIEIDPNNQWEGYGQEIIGQISVTEDMTDSGSIGLDKIGETMPDTSSSSPSGGGGGGGGSSPRVTNIYNIYNITNIIQEGGEEKGKESTEGKEEGTPSQGEAKSEGGGLAGITGGIIANLPKASPLVGSIVVIFIVVGGLAGYFFMTKKK